MQPKQLARIFSYAVITIVFLSSCNSSDDQPTSSLDEPAPPSSQRLSELAVNRTDGSVQVISFSYAESGSLLTETVRTDGEIEFESTFEVNNLGQFIRRSEDIDQDGNEDQSSNYYYKSGLGLSEIHRINADNLIYRVDTFQFEGNRVTSRERIDVAPVASPEQVDVANGNLLIRREFNYTDNRVSSIDIDSNGDGTNDKLATFQYNPNGTLATTSLTSTTEGTLNTTTYIYETGACNYNSGNSVLRYYCINGEQ